MPRYVKGIFPLAVPATARETFLMLIAWTTVATRADAETLAQAAVTRGGAACAQIDGPITSTYRWESRVETTEEYRLTFKVLPDQAGALEALVLAAHPYAAPEWVVVAAARVGEKYLSWARGTTNSSPL
ncbi:MAG: divalent-cation tolerance protein CutA [Cephaloticoccus sp.]